MKFVLFRSLAQGHTDSKKWAGVCIPVVWLIWGVALLAEVIGHVFSALGFPSPPASEGLCAAWGRKMCRSWPCPERCSMSWFESAPSGAVYGEKVSVEKVSKDRLSFSGCDALLRYPRPLAPSNGCFSLLCCLSCPRVWNWSYKACSFPLTLPEEG